MPERPWARGAASARVRALVMVALLATVPAHNGAKAAEIEGVQFPQRYQVHGTELELKCVGLLRYKVLFKAYVAALYMSEGDVPANSLGDVPKRLELSYFWSIEGDDFGPAGETLLAQNFDAAAIARLRPQLDQINTLYEDIEPGDRYSLTYIPGIGTELALNGERKGVVRGAEFAEKYFAIWLGPKPLDASLREQLLNCSRPS
jgi:hypothetical protein